MKGKRRILSILLCIVLIAALVLSFEFIITHAHHDCSGEHCPICAQLHIAGQIISGIKAVFIVYAVFSAFHNIFYIADIFYKRGRARLLTLVDLKVMLLD